MLDCFGAKLPFYRESCLPNDRWREAFLEFAVPKFATSPDELFCNRELNRAGGLFVWWEVTASGLVQLPVCA